MKKREWKAGDVCYVAVDEETDTPGIIKSTIIVQDGVEHVVLSQDEPPFPFEDYPPFRTKRDAWRHIIRNIKNRISSEVGLYAKQIRELKSEAKGYYKSEMKILARAKKQAAKCKKSRR